MLNLLMQLSVSLNELNEFAEKFWNYVNGAKVFAFYGQMGAGKTTIISTLCRKKGVQDTISSPTFPIINRYLYMENSAEKEIYHIDLYRLNDENEVLQAGVEDCIYSGGICMVEWPEKAPHLFDENVVQVFIEQFDENTRSVKIKLSLNTLQEQS